MATTYRGALGEVVRKKQRTLFFFAFVFGPIAAIPQLAFSPVLMLSDSNVSVRYRSTSALLVGIAWLSWVRSQRSLVDRPRAYHLIDVGVSRTQMALGDVFRAAIVCWPLLLLCMALRSVCDANGVRLTMAYLIAVTATATLIDLFFGSMRRRICGRQTRVTSGAMILVRYAARDVLAWTQPRNAWYHFISALLLAASLYMAKDPSQKDLHMYFFVAMGIAAFLPLLVLTMRADERHRKMTDFLGGCAGDRMLSVYRAALIGGSFVVANCMIVSWFICEDLIDPVLAVRLPCFSSLIAILFVCGRVLSVPCRAEFFLLLLPLAYLFVVEVGA